MTLNNPESLLAPSRAMANIAYPAAVLREVLALCLNHSKHKHTQAKHHRLNYLNTGIQHVWSTSSVV